MYTKFAKFARLYFLQFTIFHIYYDSLLLETMYNYGKNHDLVCFIKIIEHATGLASQQTYTERWSRH